MKRFKEKYSQDRVVLHPVLDQGKTMVSNLNSKLEGEFPPTEGKLMQGQILPNIQTPHGFKKR